MTFYFAILLGLLGSSHCVGMCGGLVMAMNSRSEQALRTQNEHAWHNSLLNFGRVSTYILLAVVFASLASVAGDYIAMPQWGAAMRVVVVVAMSMLAIQLLTDKSLFAFLETATQPMWHRIKKPFAYLLKKNSMGASFLIGMLWGLVPCGLVYSLFIVAAAGNDVLQAALLLLGFGLGTLPALFLTGMASVRLGQFVRNKGVRRAGGVLLLSAAAWTLLMPLLIDHSSLHISPFFQSLTLCFT